MKVVSYAILLLALFGSVHASAQISGLRQRQRNTALTIRALRNSAFEAVTKAKEDNDQAVAELEAAKQSGDQAAIKAAETKATTTANALSRAEITLKQLDAREVSYLTYLKKMNQTYRQLNPAGAKPAAGASTDGNGHTVDAPGAAELPDFVDFVPQSPPNGVDDPGTPCKGCGEFNIFFNVDKIKNPAEGVVPLMINPVYLDANYGLTDNVQLKAEIGLPTITGGNGQPMQAGLGDAEFGVKWHFMGADDTINAAVYPQFNVHTGSQSEDSLWVKVPLMVSKEFEGPEIGVTGNVGIQKTYSGTAPSELQLGVGVGKLITRRFSVMTDVMGVKALSGDNRKMDVTVSFGGIVKIKDNHYAFFTVRHEWDPDGQVHNGIEGGYKWTPPNLLHLNRDKKQN